LNIDGRQLFPGAMRPRRAHFRRASVQYAGVEHEQDVIEMNGACFEVSGRVQGSSSRMAA